MIFPRNQRNAARPCARSAMENSRQPNRWRILHRRRCAAGGASPALIWCMLCSAPPKTWLRRRMGTHLGVTVIGEHFPLFQIVEQRIHFGFGGENHFPATSTNIFVSC